VRKRLTRCPASNRSLAACVPASIVAFDDAAAVAARVSFGLAAPVS